MPLRVPLPCSTLQGSGRETLFRAELLELRELRELRELGKAGRGMERVETSSNEA